MFDGALKRDVVVLNVTYSLSDTKAHIIIRIILQG